jgi:hypothetical protein
MPSLDIFPSMGSASLWEAFQKLRNPGAPQIYITRWRPSLKKSEKGSALPARSSAHWPPVPLIPTRPQQLAILHCLPASGTSLGEAPANFQSDCMPPTYVKEATPLPSKKSKREAHICVCLATLSNRGCYHRLL